MLLLLFVVLIKLWGFPASPTVLRSSVRQEPLASKEVPSCVLLGVYEQQCFIQFGTHVCVKQCLECGVNFPGTFAPTRTSACMYAKFVEIGPAGVISLVIYDPAMKILAQVCEVVLNCCVNLCCASQNSSLVFCPRCMRRMKAYHHSDIEREIRDREIRQKPP